MKDIKLVQTAGGSWDIAYENGDQVFVEGIDALIQRIRIKMAHISGEWYLKTDDGTLNLSILGAKGREIGVGKQIIRESLLADQEVLGIVSIFADFDNKTRKMTVAVEVSTVYGDSGKVTIL